MEILDKSPDIKMEIATGTNNEGSLHAAIKKWYAMPGDRLEARLDDYIIDILRKDTLIEIQTRNFSAIGKKLRKLKKNFKVRLVYPIPEEKWIVYTGENPDEVLSRRKSPKKGKPADIFKELVRIPELINDDNFALEVLMIKEEEIRRNDGKGSWRRKGISIIDRRLVDIVDKICFENKHDFYMFIPEDMPQPFTNKNLAKALGITVQQARKATYCLRKIGTIKETGKIRNELLFEVII